MPPADIVTPNRFELAHLTGLQIESLADALAAAAELRAHGPRLVIVTGLSLPDRPGRAGGARRCARTRPGWSRRRACRWRSAAAPATPFQALFLGHYLAAGELRAGLERAVAAMFALVERTCAAGGEELELVAAQDEFVVSSTPFRAERLR